jgi:hypothetical protein
VLFNILAVVAGFIAGGVAVGIVEMIGMTLVPPPPELIEAIKAEDFQRAAELINTLPLVSFLYVLLAYAVGAFLGGLVASSICPTMSRPWPALIVGGLLLLTGLMNVVMLPHPLWFTVVSLLIFLPAAWQGSRLAERLFPGLGSPAKGSR